MNLVLKLSYMTNEEFKISSDNEPQPDLIPELEIVSRVYVINKEHPKYLDSGIITNKSHIHYRIKFLDGMIIWMPEHWVRPLPEEML